MKDETTVFPLAVQYSTFLSSLLCRNSQEVLGSLHKSLQRVRSDRDTVRFQQFFVQLLEEGSEP